MEIFLLFGEAFQRINDNPSLIFWIVRKEAMFTSVVSELKDNKPFEKKSCIIDSSKVVVTTQSLTHSLSLLKIYHAFYYSYCRDQRNAADIILQYTTNVIKINYQIRNTYLSRTNHQSTTSNRKKF
mgnify:CR=1 FL=1